ncbi:hypothetical protein EYF80_046758 [Liparis tanakae]|uniref:Uncharacterized protein n=1 Tax=Liparis tanakae TaxID=230148 RepID=A0A4Z2FPG4_9TELE|nr:hypothetical protein EYF80_046758 [Liparis tanakae]
MMLRSGDSVAPEELTPDQRWTSRPASISWPKHLQLPVLLAVSQHGEEAHSEDSQLDLTTRGILHKNLEEGDERGV